MAAGGAADVGEVGVRVGLGGEGLLAAAAGRQQLPLLRVSPFHPAVLKPDLHLEERDVSDSVQLKSDGSKSNSWTE